MDTKTLLLSLSSWQKYLYFLGNQALVRHTQFISQAVASCKVQTDKRKDKRLRALGEVEPKFIKPEEEKWHTSTWKHDSLFADVYNSSDRSVQIHLIPKRIYFLSPLFSLEAVITLCFLCEEAAAAVYTLRSVIHSSWVSAEFEQKQKIICKKNTA
jgi:hypothetical protein